MEDKQDPNRIPQEAPYILSPEELESFRKSFDTLPAFPPIREPILSVRFGIPKFGIPYPDSSCLDYICGYVDVSIEFNSGQHRRARINLTEKNTLYPYYNAMSWEGVHTDVYDALSGTTGFAEIPQDTQERLVLVDVQGHSRKFPNIKTLQLYLVMKGIFLRGRELNEVEQKHPVILKGLIIYWTTE